jgi:hypothetical protein
LIYFSLLIIITPVSASTVTDEIPHQGVSLFPEVEDSMAELPLLKDGSLSSVAASRVHDLEQALAYEETILGEGFVESLAVCVAVACLVMLPLLDW